MLPISTSARTTLAATVAVLLVGCAPTSPSASQPTDASPTSNPTAASAAATPAAIQGDVPDDTQAASVDKVVDGDTLWVTPTEGGPLDPAASHKIRLLEIDAPESTSHRYGHPECFGQQATDQLAALAGPGDGVLLTTDEELTDRYGRHLRYVFLADGTHINLQMAATGHAAATLYPPNDRYWPQIRAAAGQAQTEQIGMWSCPDQPTNTDGADTSDTDGSGTTQDCSPHYTGACIPPAPPDLDCSDLAATNFGADTTDPHNLDGNSDGTACET